MCLLVCVLCCSLLGDAEEPHALLRIANLVANKKKELTLAVTGSDHASIEMTHIMLKQFNRFGMDRSTLLITDDVDSCDIFFQNTFAHCMWSSKVLEKAPARSTSLSRFWDGRFRFYATKKFYMAVLVQAGFTVFQADMDMVIHKDPWPVFRQMTQKCSILVQNDRPIANAGMIVARPNSAEGLSLLLDVAWRVQVFQHRPSVVKKVVPFAKPPFYANSDDQTILNDAIISAVTGNRTFLGAQGRYETKNVHNPFSSLSWTSLPEFELYKALLRKTWSKKETLYVQGIKTIAFPYAENSSDYICVAPAWLMGHVQDGEVNYVQHLAAARGSAEKLRLLRSGLADNV